MKNFSLNIKKSSLRGNLLAALLMVTASLLYSVTAMAEDKAGVFTENAFKVKFKGGSTVEISGNSSGVASTALGVVSTLGIDKWEFWTWNKENAGNICGGTFYYKIGSSGTVNNESGSTDWGTYKDGSRNNKHYKDPSSKTSIVTSSTAPGNYTLYFWFSSTGNPSGKDGCSTTFYLNNGGSDYQATYTVPGFSQTAVSETSYSCAPNATESKTVSFTKHYGTALTTSNCVLSGTDAASFEVTAVSTTGVTIKFKPTTSGTKNATCTITDAHSKVCTVTLQGTATATGTAPEVLLAADAVVEDTQVTLSGYLRLTGCNDVTEFGFLYSKTKSDLEAATPTGTKLEATSPAAPIVSGTGAGTEFSGTGTFEGQTKYYYKTYAINTRGTSYSTEIGEFETSGCVKPKVSAISVPATICSNVGTFEATATCSLPSTYVWSATGVLSIEGEQTGATVNVTVSGAGTGSLTVTPTSTSDHCVGDPKTLSDITVVDATLDNPVISGDAEVCEGVAEMQFTVTAAGATTYAWTVTGTGWSISSGADAATVTVVPGTTDGTVAVTVSNACQNKNTDKVVTISPKPAVPGEITGTQTVCKGTGYQYSVVAVSGAEEYEWILPSGWTGVCDPSNKNIITATPGENAADGTIKVKAVNDCGDRGYNTGIEVTVGGYDITITGVGAKSASATYPWELFSLTATTDAENVTWNAVYSTALDPTLTVLKQNGKSATLKSGAPVSDTEHYTVTATSTDGGCESTSDGYDVYINAAQEEICGD